MYQMLADKVLAWAMPKVPNSHIMQQQFNQMVQGGATPSQLMHGLEDMARQSGAISAFENNASWNALKNKNPNPDEVEPFVKSTLSEMGVLNKIMNFFIGGNNNA